MLLSSSSHSSILTLYKLHCKGVNMFNFFNKKKKRVDIQVLRQRAKNNDTNAQYELSLAYYRGREVPKDMEKSNYWFRKAHGYTGT